MRRSMMDILCCPVCKGELGLRVVEEDGDDIITGGLWCGACEVEYPITEGIPDLLPRTGDEEDE